MIFLTQKFNIKKNDDPISVGKNLFENWSLIGDRKNKFKIFSIYYVRGV